MGFMTWKLVHLLAVMLVFVGIGGLALISRAEVAIGTEGDARPIAPLRQVRFVFWLGVFSVLVAGIMMVRELHFTMGPPAWIKLKLIVLILLGILFPLAARKPHLAKTMIMPAGILLGGLAGYLAVFKPF